MSVTVFPILTCVILPELKPVRKQIIEDALLVIGITMDGVINEIIDEGGRIK